VKNERVGDVYHNKEISTSVSCFKVPGLNFSSETGYPHLGFLFFFRPSRQMLG